MQKRLNILSQLLYQNQNRDVCQNKIIKIALFYYITPTLNNLPLKNKMVFRLKTF